MVFLIIMIQIRNYIPSDKSAVINLLRLNTPTFFAPAEERDFEQYLESELEDYFVVIEKDKIIGCGGVNYFPSEKSARISWDMISPQFHGKGIGKQLVENRLQLLLKNPEIDFIVVRTSQHTFQFYEKMGFEIKQVVKDFWAEGFDLYEMTLNNA